MNAGQLATAFYCCQLVLCINAVAALVHIKQLSLSVPLINVYKIPGYDSSQFCHINEPLRIVRSIFDNSFGFYFENQRHHLFALLIEMYWLIGAVMTELLWQTGVKNVIKSTNNKKKKRCLDDY